TGVQTCALPILATSLANRAKGARLAFSCDRALFDGRDDRGSRKPVAFFGLQLDGAGAWSLDGRFHLHGFNGSDGIAFGNGVTVGDFPGDEVGIERRSDCAVRALRAVCARAGCGGGGIEKLHWDANIDELAVDFHGDVLALGVDGLDLFDLMRGRWAVVVVDPVSKHPELVARQRRFFHHVAVEGQDGAYAFYVEFAQGTLGAA